MVVSDNLTVPHALQQIALKGVILHENSSFLIAEETISRCMPTTSEHNPKALFRLAQPTPGKPNDCGNQLSANNTFATATVVINEVDARQTRNHDQDPSEFVELIDYSGGNTSLSGLVMVFFNGAASPPSAYLVLDLAGYRTNDEGYFVVGRPGCLCQPNLPVQSRFLQNGPDAIALYKVPYGWFAPGSLPTTRNMVDAVIYTRRSSRIAPPELRVLLPGQEQLVERSEFSLSRCSTSQPRELASFRNAVPSPNAENLCGQSSLGTSQYTIGQPTRRFVSPVAQFSTSESPTHGSSNMVTPTNGRETGTSSKVYKFWPHSTVHA